MKRRSVALALFVSIVVVAVKLIAFAQTPNPSPTPPSPPGHVILIGFGPGGKRIVLKSQVGQKPRRADEVDYDPRHVDVSKDARGYEYFQEDADGLTLFNTVRHIYVTLPESAENQLVSQPLSNDYSLVFVKRRPASSRQNPSYCWVARVDPRIQNPFKIGSNASTRPGSRINSGYYEISSSGRETVIITKYPLLFASRSGALPECPLQN